MGLEKAMLSGTHNSRLVSGFSPARGEITTTLRAIPQVRDDRAYTRNGQSGAEPDAFQELVELSKKQTRNRKQDVGHLQISPDILHQYGVVLCYCKIDSETPKAPRSVSVASEADMNVDLTHVQWVRMQLSLEADWPRCEDPDTTTWERLIGRKDCTRCYQMPSWRHACFAARAARVQAEACFWGLLSVLFKGVQGDWAWRDSAQGELIRFPHHSRGTVVVCTPQCPINDPISDILASWVHLICSPL